jgi:hypothetical protein
MGNSDFLYTSRHLQNWTKCVPVDVRGVSAVQRNAWKTLVDVGGRDQFVLVKVAPRSAG